MKSYTDLEQSKKLAKILPLESADMFYRDNGIDVKLMWEHNTQKVKYPCWSLAALLDIIDSVKMYGMNRVTMIVGKYAANQWFVELERVHDNSSAMLTASKQLIDACVEMIVKLHEQKLL